MGRALAFPRALWNDLRVELSVVRGKVRWLDRSAGCPVCFDRTGWDLWRGLPARPAAPVTTKEKPRADRKGRQRETLRLIEDLYGGLPPDWEPAPAIKRRLAKEKNFNVGTTLSAAH